MQRVLLKFAIVRAFIYGFVLGALCSCEKLDKAFEDESYDITCYSAGTITYHGYVIRASHSNNLWTMREKATNKFIRITGDCVVIEE